MKFLHQSIEAKKKEILEVEIDTATKVKFMTGKELKAYRVGKTYSFYGGLFEESPVRFVVPYDAVWTVVVEKGTMQNPIEVNASVRRLSPNNSVRSTIASDAPPHVRAAEGLLEAETARIAAEMSLAGKSEG
jgi:hypothetical protein